MGQGRVPAAIWLIASGRVSHSLAKTRLASDSAVVVFIVDQMHCAAGDRAAALDNRPVDVHPMKALAPKGGQERRMDVDHAASKVGGNLHQMQKARHHDEIGLDRPASVEDRTAPVGAASACWGQDRHGDTSSLCDSHAADILPA